MPAGVRPPAVAGQFYPQDPAGLTQLLERCYADPRGPGRLTPARSSLDRRIRAAVVPHAGYVYSGPIAAHAYRAVAAERPPGTVLVLGVNHHGRGAPAALSAREWRTPLGTVRTDPELIAALDRRPIERDELAHGPEHSIEVQLPFLQQLWPQLRFVGLSITMGPIGFLADVGAVVTRAVQGRDVLLLASTDFSHYIPAETARSLDRLAINQILARNPTGLYETVVDREISMCGIAPATVLLFALQAEPLRTRLLRWGHSGEAEPMTEVVGYASILLESDLPFPPGPATAA